MAPQSGTSASMPRWADLHIYLSVDFDMGSAITVAFGWKAFWYEPRGFNSPLTGQRQPRNWPATARIVVDRDLHTEQQELLAFLREIHTILAWTQQQDQQLLANPALANLSAPKRQDYRTKVQFYLWDQPGTSTSRACLVDTCRRSSSTMISRIWRGSFHPKSC